ncbi:pentapeptide repeat-containing protein [Methylomonas sp. YC3]
MHYQDYDAAEAAFSRLLQLRPKDLKALEGRADARYKQALYELALSDYQSIQKLDKQNNAARHGKTLALLKLGRTQELGDDRDFSGYENKSEHPSFVGLNLVGANFRGAKLKGIDFSSADLTNSDFSEADIRNCSFIGAKLSRAKFRNLKSAYETQFNHADLEHTDFSEADLVLANFDNAILDNANFSEANMEHASFEGASIKNAKLNGKSLIQAKLRNLRFLNQDLSGMDLRGADLRGSTFRSTNIDGTAFGVAASNINSIMSGEMTNLQGVDLSEANLSHVDWGVAVIADCRTKLPSNLDLTSLPVFPVWTNCEGMPPKTKSLGGYPFRRGPIVQNLNAQNSFFANQEFSGFWFWQSNFDNSDFSHATLIGLDIQGGSYNKANFEYTNLTNAHFTAVNFTEASFAHADLSNAKLREVDFSSANLEEAKLTGLCFDVKSKWPEGFDPLAAGAKLCE